MKSRTSILVLLLMTVAVTVPAQQAQEFDDYTIHYNALNTSQLTPQVAQAYGIRRSSSRALLNITVLRNHDEASDALTGGEAVEAAVQASARNLTGQNREIEMRKITEADEAIYYIGEFRVNNMEMFDFTVRVLPAGSTELLEVTFRQQFYTE